MGESWFTTCEHVMLVEKCAQELCQPRLVFISCDFDGTQGVYSGLCRFETRLTDCIGFRVKYFNISMDTPGAALHRGAILALVSSRLASNISDNIARLGVSSNTGDTRVVNSNIVGWTVRNINGTSFSAASTCDPATINPFVKFARPVHLDEFDWLLSPLSGSLPVPMGAVYQIEIAIEFRQLCSCQSRVHDSYY